MKPLTTSIYTFSDLIRGGYQYVDKTGQIYELIRDYKDQYFLSRPRRFGKSLLLSTLKSIFLGQREFFDGLKITDLDYEWQTYPVIHLDLASVRSRTIEELESGLLRRVRMSAREYDYELTASNCYDAFEDLIRGLHDQHGSVVLLIDEYDKPLLKHLDGELVEDVQSVLKTFYSIIKTTESYQRFVLLTGVSKFSKVSIFSDLNNLTDLTMQSRAATLLGYTQSELEDYFGGYIQRLSEACDMPYNATIDELRDWYNGYKFEENAKTVYNPVSVMKCFQERKFQNYWFETGTPTFLLDLLKKRPMELGEMKALETSFSSYEPDNIDPLPLLFQTGYLTIKTMEWKGRRREYVLDYPNFEIEESFNLWLAQHFCHMSSAEFSSSLHNLVASLEEGRVEEMLEHLKTFFAGVPNTISVRREKYYQTIFYTIFQLIGAMIQVEVSTSTGRIDATVETDDDIFIFEFKLRGTAQDAMSQIRERGYAAPYRDDPRPVTLVGVSFDSDVRNIDDWACETA